MDSILPLVAAGLTSILIIVLAAVFMRKKEKQQEIRNVESGLSSYGIYSWLLQKQYASGSL